MKILLHLSPAGPQYWAKENQGWQLLPAVPDTQVPIWVMTNLAEESFAEIDIPRLYGRDRSDLITRQLATRFPDTPYRTKLKISHGGTLRDRLAPVHFTLFGISAADKLNTEFDGTGIPIAGITATSLLLTSLGQHKRLPADLFIVLPNPGALRIVFLKNRIPLLTRLAPIPDDVGAQVEEIVRTVRYLENTRTLQRGAKTNPVLILGDAGAFAAPLAAAKLELIAPPPPWDAKPPADWRFPLFDLACQPSPYGQVAPLARRTEYFAEHLRNVALVAAAACLVAGLWASTQNVLDSIEIVNSKELTQATAQRLNTQVNDLEQRIGGFGATPDLVRRTVALYDDEIASAPRIDRQLQLIASALDDNGNIRLANLEWRLLPAAATPCTKTGAPSAAAAGAGAAPESAEPATPERKVEVTFDLTLPQSSSPRSKAQALRDISARLARIKGASLVQDPAKELAKGTLRGGALVAVEENKNPAWCMTLPGSSKETAKEAATAISGGPQS